jgi:hypothetical protein
MLAVSTIAEPLMWDRNLWSPVGLLLLYSFSNSPAAIPWALQPLDYTIPPTIPASHDPHLLLQLVFFRLESNRLVPAKAPTTSSSSCRQERQLLFLLILILQNTLSSILADPNKDSK